MGDVAGAVNAVTGGFSLKDLVAGYVDIQKAKLGSGVAMQDNTIDQLKGTVSLLAQQNRALLGAQTQTGAGLSSFNLSSVAPWLVLAVGGFLVYKLVK